MDKKKVDLETRWYTHTSMIFSFKLFSDFTVLFLDQITAVKLHAQRFCYFASCRETLELGSSVQWPEAMKKLTGQEKFDATAISTYFRPLMKWLKDYRQREGYHRGWKDESDVLRECFTGS